MPDQKQTSHKQTDHKDHDHLLRQHLVKLLTGSEAHADFEAAVEGLPAELRGKVPENAQHSAWQLVDHMRITLWDLVEFSRDARHKSPKWPDEYWPKTAEPPSEKAWEASIEDYRKHLKAMVNLVSDESIDLFARIPHGDGQTLLREALLAADHTAYHVGALVLLRRLLGAWS